MTYIPGIRWVRHTKYVDIDTGEILHPKLAEDKQKFIIIKTIKDETTNRPQTRGVIRYTKQCRRTPQTKLDFSGNGKD